MTNNKTKRWLPSKYQGSTGCRPRLRSILLPPLLLPFETTETTTTTTTKIALTRAIPLEQQTPEKSHATRNSRLRHHGNYKRRITTAALVAAAAVPVPYWLERNGRSKTWTRALPPPMWKPRLPRPRSGPTAPRSDCTGLRRPRPPNPMCRVPTSDQSEQDRTGPDRKKTERTCSPNHCNPYKHTQTHIPTHTHPLEQNTTPIEPSCGVREKNEKRKIKDNMGVVDHTVMVRCHSLESRV